MFTTKKCSKNTKKTKKLFNNYIIETEELNQKVDNVEKVKDDAVFIKQYGDIIRTKKEKTLCPSLIMKEKLLKDSKRRKRLSN